MKVHLRKRKQTSNGRVSLYLEIYKGTALSPAGKPKTMRDYEYLDLYLIDKPKTTVEKESNKSTLALAEKIKTSRQNDIDNGKYGFSSGFKLNTNFVDYFKHQAEKRKESQGNYGNWDSSIKHLIKFAGGENITFREIDDKFCEGFKNHLGKARKSNGEKLSSSAVSSYFNKFRACLKKAVKEQIIQSNPSLDVSNPKVIEGSREYLTLNELKAVAKTECRYDVLKRAFIFSCLTGLRWSDVQKLQWSELQKLDDGWKIIFNQKKTKGLQYLDLSDQARSYLGEIQGPKERIFKGLTYSSYMNVELTRWMLKAGITKHITFHCARHTYAVLQLTLGTDIYTLSKMLGHSQLKTTQVYAKIIDEKKKEAANRIPDIHI